MFANRFKETNLAGANLSGADLSRANLWGANLTGANLTGATMPAPFYFEQANLSGATWTDGRKCGPDSIGVCK